MAPPDEPPDEVQRTSAPNDSIVQIIPCEAFECPAGLLSVAFALRSIDSQVGGVQLVTTIIDVIWWVLWVLGTTVLVVLLALYCCKMVHYPSLVWREHDDPKKNNILQLSFVAVILVVLGAPVDMVVSPIMWIIAVVNVIICSRVCGGILNGEADLGVSLSVPPLSTLLVATMAGLLGEHGMITFLFTVGTALVLLVFLAVLQRSSVEGRQPHQVDPVLRLLIIAPCSYHSVVAAIQREHHCSQGGGGCVLWSLLADGGFYFALFLVCVMALNLCDIMGHSFSYDWWALITSLSAFTTALAYSPKLDEDSKQVIVMVFVVITLVVVIVLLFKTIIYALHRSTKLCFLP